MTSTPSSTSVWDLTDAAVSAAGSTSGGRTETSRVEAVRAAHSSVTRSTVTHVMIRCPHTSGHVVYNIVLIIIKFDENLQTEEKLT